jgi:hypothetical protein
MSTERAWLSTIAVNGKIYAMSGYDGSRHLGLVEEYISDLQANASD